MLAKLRTEAQKELCDLAKSALRPQKARASKFPSERSTSRCSSKKKAQETSRPKIIVSEADSEMVTVAQMPEAPSRGDMGRSQTSTPSVQDSGLALQPGSPWHKAQEAVGRKLSSLRRDLLLPSPAASEIGSMSASLEIDALEPAPAATPPAGTSYKALWRRASMIAVAFAQPVKSPSGRRATMHSLKEHQATKQEHENLEDPEEERPEDEHVRGIMLGLVCLKVQRRWRQFKEMRKRARDDSGRALPAAEARAELKLPAVLPLTFENQASPVAIAEDDDDDEADSGSHRPRRPSTPSQRLEPSPSHTAQLPPPEPVGGAEGAASQASYEEDWGSEAKSSGSSGEKRPRGQVEERKSSEASYEEDFASDAGEDLSPTRIPDPGEASEVGSFAEETEASLAAVTPSSAAAAARPEDGESHEGYSDDDFGSNSDSSGD